ncbi:MAG: oligosaccharide flippase family protein [Pleurocapsa sp.]
MNLVTIRAKIRNLFRSNLARDTLWMLVSKLFNVVMQAGYFIIVARVLGAKNYGSFIGITALASIIFPFVALGGEHILVKYVSTDKSKFGVFWGNTLVLLVCNSLAITLILLLFSPRIFVGDISRISVGLILLADLLCLGLLDISYKALMAIDRVNKTAQMGILATCGKLLAALCLAVLFKSPNINTWAGLYFTASVIMSAIAMILVYKLGGYPRPVFSILKSNIKQGIYFSISASAQNINANLDKTMLASLSSLTSTGIYGSAYRFIDVGNVPLMALFGATYTRFFQHGASGIRGSLKFAQGLLPLIMGYAVVSVIGYYILAPFIPLILGEEYRDAIATLRWLAPLPAIAAFQYLAADTLTGGGHQKARSIVQVTAAIVNVVLNLWLIPLYSWKGAAWATLISDSLRLVCLWVILFLLCRQAPKSKNI